MSNEIKQRAESYLAAEHLLSKVDGYGRDMTVTITTPKNLGVKVSWNWGSSTIGYEEIRVGVEQRVAEKLPGLIQEVVEAARRDADQKLRALTGLAARLDPLLPGNSKS